MSRTHTVEIDYDDLPKIRDRELAVIRRYDSDDEEHSRGPRPARQEAYEYRHKRFVYEDDAPRSRRRNDHDYGTGDRYSVVPYDRNRGIDAYNRRDRDAYDDNHDYDERRRNRDGMREPDDHGYGSSRRRNRRERRDPDRGGAGSSADGDSGDDGLVFFSGQKRKDANFIERNFDSSYEGVTAAIAGGLIGGMTARRFAEGENKAGKTIAAAAVGAASFNAAENWYRVFTAEREERKERQKERRHAYRDG